MEYEYELKSDAIWRRPAPERVTLNTIVCKSVKFLCAQASACFSRISRRRFAHDFAASNELVVPAFVIGRMCPGDLVRNLRQKFHASFVITPPSVYIVWTREILGTSAADVFGIVG